MRGLILTFLLSCVLVENCPAQRFKLELHGGIAGTQMSGDQLSGFNKPGLFAGAGVQADLSQKTALGFRMLFFQRGSQKRLRNDSTDTEYYLLRLNYLEVPLTFRYQLKERFTVEAGPSIGYLISSYEADFNGELPASRPFNTLDFSLMGSIGYRIHPKLGFQFGYWQSILPVREHLSGETFRWNKGQYSSAITFSLVYSVESSRKEGKE